MSSVYVTFFYFFCSVSYWPTPYYTTLFLFVKRGREVVPVELDVRNYHRTCSTVCTRAHYVGSSTRSPTSTPLYVVYRGCGEKGRVIGGVL